MLVIGSVFAMLFGVIMMLKAEDVIRLTENWRSESMSGWSVRLIGGAISGAGIVGFVLACMS